MLAFGAALATRSGTTLPSSAGSQRSPLSGAGAGHPALGHADVAALHVEDAAGDVRRLGAAQPHHDGRDVGRVEAGRTPRACCSADCRAHAEVLGHAGQRGRRDGVHRDAVALELHGGDDGEGGDAGLGRAVVGLAHVAVDARGRRGVDDAGVVRLAGLGAVAPVLHGVAGRGEGAAQVHLDHGVPLVDRHVDQHAVAQDARVVHQHVEAAEGVDGRLDQPARARRSPRRRRRWPPPRRPCRGSRRPPRRPARSEDPEPSTSPPRSLTTTLAPWLANSSACSRPMPRPAPVMTTTRPSQIPTFSSLSWSVRWSGPASTPSGLLRPVLVAQLPLEDLPSILPRQLRDEVDAARALEVGQVRPGRTP